MILMFSLRVDHLYTFFVQWSPNIYSDPRRKHGFLLVDKKELAEIDSLLRDPEPEHWNVRILTLFTLETPSPHDTHTHTHLPTHTQTHTHTSSHNGESCTTC